MATAILVVRRSANSPRHFDIVNRVTGVVVEGGFSNRHTAHEYMWKEFDEMTGKSLDGPYTGR